MFSRHFTFPSEIVFGLWMFFAIVTGGSGQFRIALFLKLMKRRFPSLYLTFWQIVLYFFVESSSRCVFWSHTPQPQFTKIGRSPQRNMALTDSNCPMSATHDMNSTHRSNCQNVGSTPQEFDRQKCSRGTSWSHDSTPVQCGKDDVMESQLLLTETHNQFIREITDQ